MRELFEAIRKHPRIAGITVAAVLGYVLKFATDKLILDGLRDLIFAAIGRWLGISDVNALVALLSYIIPVALAAAIIWGVYRYAQYTATAPPAPKNLKSQVAPQSTRPVGPPYVENFRVQIDGWGATVNAHAAFAASQPLDRLHAVLQTAQLRDDAWVQGSGWTAVSVVGRELKWEQVYRKQSLQFELVTRSIGLFGNGLASMPVGVTRYRVHFFTTDRDNAQTIEFALRHYMEPSPGFDVLPVDSLPPIVWTVLA